MEWLNLTEIFLKLAACAACYLWGKSNGVGGTLAILLDKKIITLKDLEKING